MKKIFRNVLFLGILVLSLSLSACNSMSPTKDAIALGGEWFLNNQDENFIHYEYYPITDVHSNDHHAMREMGAMWSIIELHKFLEDDRYLDLANKGFAYFEETFKEDEELGIMYVNVTPEKIKLGYSGFAILTLLDLDHPKKDEYLEKLAKGIMYQQNDNGELRTFFFSDRATGVDYYPGEALLGMMSLYEATENEEYLETVKKAFPFYRDYYRSNPNTAFVPWQTQAYFKLYQATKDKEVLDFIFEMNDFIVDEYTIGERDCDGFYMENKSSVVAVHVEGMTRAFELAKEVDDYDRKVCYKNFIKEGMDLTLQLQFTEENNFGLEDHGISAIGGIVGSKTSFESMRVDRNQHGVMALIRSYDLGILK